MASRRSEQIISNGALSSESAGTCQLTAGLFSAFYRSYLIPLPGVSLLSFGILPPELDLFVSVWSELLS
jgi:hypothetical protein